MVLLSFYAQISSASSSFLIAPWIEIESLRKRDLNHKKGSSENKIPSWAVFKSLLDSMEPHGPAGSVQLGYTVSVNIYDLFAKQASGEWRFQPELMNYFLVLIKNVSRPVVVHLSMNHFVGTSGLAQWIAEDPKSLARFQDDDVCCEKYFESEVIGFTFSQNPELRINKYRFNGLRKAAEMLADFEKKNPSLIRAITIAGEIHQFLPHLSDPSGAGRYENVKTTDYSQASIADFRLHLQKKYGTVTKMNQELETAFPVWADVVPPRWDLRGDKAAPAFLHMDSFAHGSFPVSGWLAPKTGDVIEIFVNGLAQGKADLDQSRLDVYEAIENFHRADVGFYKDVSYRKLPPGRHLLEVILKRGGSEYLLEERYFSVCPNLPKGNPFTKCSFSEPDKTSSTPGRVRFIRGDDKNPTFYLDHPKDGGRYWFNRFAEEWQTFRESQVQLLIEEFSKTAVASGLPLQKLFSHSMTPFFEGSWNRAAFALTEKSVVGSGLNLGINLYGGSAISNFVLGFAKGRSYGICELNPRMGKYPDRGIFSEILRRHQQNGAQFVSPYFMTLDSPQEGALTGLAIGPLNTAYASNFVYQAIVEAVAR